MDKLYTVDEVMALLQVTQRTIYNYIKSGKIKAIKVGKYWRFTEESIQEFLTDNTKG